MPIDRYTAEEENDRQQFHDWKSHPLTDRFINSLEKKRETIIRDLSISSHKIVSSGNNIQSQCAEYLGALNLIDDLLYGGLEWLLISDN